MVKALAIFFVSIGISTVAQAMVTQAQQDSAFKLCPSLKNIVSQMNVVAKNMVSAEEGQNGYAAKVSEQMDALRGEYDHAVVACANRKRSAP